MCPKNRITSSYRIPLDLGTILSQDIPGFLGIYHNSYSNLCSREYMAIILLQACIKHAILRWHLHSSPLLSKSSALWASSNQGSKGSAAEPLPTNLCEGDDPHLLFQKELCGSSNFMMPSGSQGNKNDIFPKKNPSLQKSHDQQHLVGVGFHPMSRKYSNSKDSPRY